METRKKWLRRTVMHLLLERDGLRCGPTVKCQINNL